jgi:hypothetical protein
VLPCAMDGVYVEVKNSLKACAIMNAYDASHVCLLEVAIHLVASTLTSIVYIAN